MCKTTQEEDKIKFMNQVFNITILLVFLSTAAFAQMINGSDTLYGNEWINHSQTYFKIKVPSDGVYRITEQTLANAGIPTSTVLGSEWQIFHLGKEIPLFTSSSGIFTATDYIDFLGEQNRAALDSFLFANPSADLLNPYYSLFTDTAAYYLTWSNAATGLRYTNLPNNLANPPAKEEFYMHDLVMEYHSSFIKKRSSGYIYDSKFEVEGFSNSLTQNRTINLALSNIVTTGSPATLTVRLATAEDGAHHQVITVAGTTVVDENFSGYRLKNYTIPLAAATLTNTLQVKMLNDANSKDKNSTANLVLNYPRAFNFSNKKFFEFYIDASPNARYLEIENFSANSTDPILLDVTNGIAIQGTFESNGNKIKILLPPSTEKRRLFLYNPVSGIQNVASLEAKTFTDFSQMNGDYIIISNARLFNEPNTNINWVQEYADYRSFADGGGYNAMVIDVAELYEQFAYGIQRHPISIRNFGHYIKKNWTNPKYVFLIGKGMEYNFLRTAANLNLYEGEHFFVPTFGYVGSDNMLLAPPNGNIPIIPMGRLAARTPAHVQIYLKKVKQHEANMRLPQTLADKAWMKRIVHLGGGDPTIQNSIKGHLANFENIITNNQYGGNVISFFKTSSDPIQISQSDRITETINSGVSVLTFFGHSYAGGFDVSLDEPSFYDNEGRYPLILSYGCYSGRIHSNSVGISESFLLESGRGAIAFMSSNGLATVSGLRTFGDEFYKQLGGDNYGNGLGDVLQSTNRNTQNFTGDIARQMTLHGDPAVRLNTHPGPDFTIDPASVEFSPKKIDVQLDSFSLSFQVVNIGSYLKDSTMTVKIEQELPNGTRFNLMLDTVKTPAYLLPLSYTLPTLGEAAVGLNKFYITVDNDQQIVELPFPDAESNNELKDNLGQLGTTVYFASNQIKAIYPYDLSLIGNSQPTLRATSSNAFAPMQTYVFELDTTQQFNSPFKQQKTLTQSGNLLSWQPSVTYQDSTVYYWRVSVDSVSGVGYNWSNSSFQYLSGLVETGWGQSHFYQFKDSRYFNMRLGSNRKMDFIDDYKDIIYKNLVNENSLTRTEYNINNEFGEVYRTGFNQEGDLFIAVLDSLNIEPWINPPGGRYGAFNNSPTISLRAFWFYTDNETERSKVITFLRDSVPSGNYVLFMTLQKNFAASYEPELWAADSTNLGTNLFQVLENQGAAKIRHTLVTGSVPYLFMYQKDKNALVEAIADTITDVLAGVFPLPGSWDNGSVESPKIGPARSWQTLHWRTSSPSHLETDHLSVDIIGIDTNNQELVLYENLTALDTVLNFIDAAVYPFLKLKYNALDTVQKSAANLDNWRIMYQGIPELTVASNQHFQFHGDTLEQGDKLSFEIALENISHEKADSVLVKYTVTDATNANITAYQRLKPLLEGDTAIAVFNLDTKNLQANSTLTFEVNPNNDQLEQFHFNNTAIQNFFVVADKRHPLLDVTFDGEHIMDGDIVGTQPQILIQLRDENPYLALDDTSSFKIWLVDEEGNQTRQYINGQTMIFYPADGSNLEKNNTAKIEFRPAFYTDGTYQLIVQAQDKTGNASGSIDYKISFEIITTSAISYVLNYPNPFTTSTQFVFTLTGAQVPDDLRISIYNVSGTLVKEITKAELGNLRIGQNRTEYRWDGTDNFGDRLANGVYLYRVTATINGEPLDNFYTKASPYFQNGFGKMVILR